MVTISIQCFCFNAKVRSGDLKSHCLHFSRFCGRVCCIMNELVLLYEQLLGMNGVSAALNCIWKLLCGHICFHSCIGFILLVPNCCKLIAGSHCDNLSLINWKSNIQLQYSKQHFYSFEGHSGKEMLLEGSFHKELVTEFPQ